MCGILAGRGRTVMAAETIGRNRAVIELRVGPPNRSVAVSALIGTGDVIRGLRGRHLADVAADAIVSDAAVIHASRLPESGRVAIAARSLDGDMHRRGLSLRPRPAASMAGTAFGGSAFELSARVAAFTICR